MEQTLGHRKQNQREVSEPDRNREGSEAVTRQLLCTGQLPVATSNRQ